MTAIFINESTARELTQERVENYMSSSLPNSSGILLNGSGLAEMEIVDGNYLGKFENLQVRQVERSYVEDSSIRQASPEETILCTDEKFCVHFQTVIQCCSMDFNVRLNSKYLHDKRQ